MTTVSMNDIGVNNDYGGWADSVGDVDDDEEEVDKNP